MVEWLEHVAMSKESRGVRVPSFKGIMLDCWHYSEYVAEIFRKVCSADAEQSCDAIQNLHYWEAQVRQGMGSGGDVLRRSEGAARAAME